MSRIFEHYRRSPETNRLAAGSGRLEFARTCQVIQGCLTPEPMDILDNGGGTGVYAFWLAKAGHRVWLTDGSDHHVGLALKEQEQQPVALQQIQVADALQLPFPTARFDLVLTLGPLYHLRRREARVAALRESARVLKRGGTLICAYISRFASLLDGLRQGFTDDPAYVWLVQSGLQNGQHVPPVDSPYLTEAYFHLPSEILPELRETGMVDATVQAVEGPFWMLPNLEQLLADDVRRKQLLQLIDQVAGEPSLLGATAHLLSVSRNQVDCSNEPE